MPGLATIRQTDQPLYLVPFGDHSQHVNTINRMRQAWVALPPMPIQEQVDDDPKLIDIFKQVTTSGRSSTEWRECITLNPDKRTPVTHWRSIVYWHINPIFVDAFQSLLNSVGPRIGICRAPCHLPFPICYPTRTGQPLQAKFDTNVFLVPVFLDSGVKIRVETAHPCQSHTFDLQKNPYELLWVQGGKPMEIFVEGGNPEMEDDLAGVLVRGVFLDSEGNYDWSG